MKAMTITGPADLIINQYIYPQGRTAGGCIDWGDIQEGNMMIIKSNEMVLIII